MRAYIEKLYQAQGKLRQCSPDSPEWCAIAESLPKSVPPPILAHFLRLAEYGGRGVALVRHGVCSECHIHVPAAVLAALAQPKGVHICDYCGCYLLLPADEPSPSHDPSSMKRAHRGRSAHSVLAG